jgi:hypothetical protein
VALGQTLRSAVAALSAPAWVANVVAVAALLASLYSVKVSRDIAREQADRDQTAKGMRYTIAARFEVPYVPKFVDRLAPDLPERPPYLVVPVRLILTNASVLPQALNGVMFSYDANAYYHVLGVREPSGGGVNWPLNIAPGASVAFDIDVPLPVSKQQVAAITRTLNALKPPVRSWPDFEDRVLRPTSIDSMPLLEILPRTTHFWIETLSPSPGFPRRILLSEWVPRRWRSGQRSSAPVDAQPGR